MGSRISEWLSEHPEDILTGISSLCTVGAVITGGLDTLRAQRKLQELLEKNPDATRMDIFKTCAPCYIPSMIVAGAGVGTGIASRRMSAKRIAEISAAGTALGMAAVRKYNLYRDEVRERYGNDVEQDILDAAEKRNTEETMKEVVQEAGGGYDAPMRVYEEITGMWYMRSPQEIFEGVNRVNYYYFQQNAGWISAHELIVQLLGVSYRDLEQNANDDDGDHVFGFDDYSGECVYGYFGVPFNIYTDEDEKGKFLHVGYMWMPHTRFDGSDYDGITEMIEGSVDKDPSNILFETKREPISDEELPFQ